MEKLIASFHDDIKRTDTTFVRFLHSEIAWDARLIAILGARGVGKSTLLLQHIKMHDNLNETLYVSADDLYFSSHTILELAESFYRLGGKRLYVDEIHKYQNWSYEVKQIHDHMPELKVVYTGSSILDLEKGGADLSRRKLEYHMPGLSFREYMAIAHGVVLPRASLSDITQHKVEWPDELRPLTFFKEYLRTGYYPFFKEPGYLSRLKAVIDTTLEVDIPQFANYTVATARKLRTLLHIIAQSVPFKPNMSKLAKEISLSRNELANIFIYLEKAGLISQLRADTSGVRLLAKPEKVYLSNTNLAYALSETVPEIGNLRETFFMATTSVLYSTTSSAASDFMIGDLTFEVGGRHKGGKQVENIPNSYIVKDDIERGALRTLPLWTLGMLY